MDLVTVNENSNQWKALFIRMAKGEKVNISDKNLVAEPVEGVTANVAGQDGQLQLPREAENVDDPPPLEAPIPPAYKEGTMKKRGRSSSRAPRRRSNKTKRKTIRRRRKPASSRGGRRRRTNIQRRRR